MEFMFLVRDHLKYKQNGEGSKNQREMERMKTEMPPDWKSNCL